MSIRTAVTLSPRRSAFGWALEVASLAALFAIFAILGARWTALPDQVPLHFDAAGQPDGWGGKNWLLLLLFLAGMEYIVFTAAARHQRLISLPIAINRDLPEVKSVLLGMAITFKAIVLFMLLYLTWAGVNTAIGRSAGLGKQFLPISLAAVFLALIFYLHKLWRYCV